MQQSAKTQRLTFDFVEPAQNGTRKDARICSREEENYRRCCAYIFTLWQQCCVDRGG